MEPQEFFGSFWPEMLPRLRASLARAGAPYGDHDDLLQETALRLFRMWERVDPDGKVEPLARHIALNLWRDHWRKHRREVIGDIPDQMAVQDTERSALARLEVGEVARALSALPAAAADLIRAAAQEHDLPGQPGGTPAAIRMARSRARRTLAACVKVASAVTAIAVTAGRALGRPSRTAIAAGALATLGLVLGLPLTAHAPSHPHVAAGVAKPLPVLPPAPHPTVRIDGHTARTVAVSHPARPVALVAKTNGNAGRHQPYQVKVGPSTVNLYLDVHVQGYGLRVARPAPGQSLPVCVYGSTPATVLTPDCLTK